MTEMTVQPVSDMIALRGAELPVIDRPRRPAVTPSVRPRLTWTLPKRQKWLGSLVGISAIAMIAVPTLLATLYYGLIASDQFVTEFRFAVRGPIQPPKKDDMSSLAGVGGGGLETMQDAMIIVDFINGRQAFENVQKKIDARKMFSTLDADFLTRLDPTLPMERMERYWERMVYAQIDHLTGLVTVDIRAFSDKDSLLLANAVDQVSDDMVNQLNAQEQHDVVDLAASGLARATDNWRKAQELLEKYQRQFHLIDPSQASATNEGITAGLLGQLNALTAQYRASSGYLATDSTQLELLRDQIKALQAQIPNVGNTVPGTAALSGHEEPETLAKFQSATLDAAIAAKILGNSFDAFQAAQQLAASRQVYLAVFLRPRLAESSIFPDRLASIGIVFLICLAAWALSAFVVGMIRDHIA